MTSADIPLGMRLKDQAGWNQVPADWRRMLELEPDGSLVALLDEVPVGTVATCRFGPVAWIAMMLVDERHRGRGIGRALMNAALAHLDAAGTQTVRLDASPAGRPLYASLGFAPDATILRFGGRLPQAPDTSTTATTPALPPFDQIANLDFRVNATDRRALLRRLVDEYPGTLRIAIEHGQVSGFLLARPGSRAARIGPCIAERHCGAVLFAQASEQFAGQDVVLDIPADNQPAHALATSWGLVQSGELTRMTRGPIVVEKMTEIWACSGPEKG
jgi:GNAT superfamily N-acetyltransferase